ncbi:hypothetical protein acsn021_13120 [Anaerocolumna cellulosilytica]|uniref:Uncharacterized protein n=1 Tax=Anaerocolumna cellulosilytica TaxID=433286 RepID=A0A6S6QQY5_9FIRM|nr:DUF3021 family protein [Anaerocolumna cellulosilytica]MBB5195959.1 hypothetical protein [Anaerocolumna cellulosilytica]BCJ93743.1 hypothetical protein acsn021_13120 [Anaerocolumna cellulosilytica]
MRRTIINIMSTTGITLVLLSFIGMLSGAKVICISSVFQSLAANIVIHLGYLLTRKFESKYIVVETALDIGYAIIVLISFGCIFHWYTSTPLWMLIIMSILIYIVGLLLNIFRIRKEIDTINTLLKRRNTKPN